MQSTVACDWYIILRLNATLRYFFFSCVWIPKLATGCIELATGYAKLATADFSIPVPADSSLLFSACSWLTSFQLVYYAPAGSTWPPPDYEQLIQLWTSPLLIQLPIS
ncbi:hypothetical protein F511_42877 [Dorcoceras hygrometricum]|uniref:Uncharacterized protein n=1 Tax=Dorcoceras hygrometricum TaxID=472368 RepID=A0A2Z7BZ86_9LAMI|nr:hypothetical protein F511_42877 [Dorcoceras hygrometricum]